MRRKEELPGNHSKRGDEMVMRNADILFCIRRIQAIKERLVPPSFCEMLTDKQLTEVCAVFDKRGNTSELVVKHSHIL